MVVTVKAIRAHVKNGQIVLDDAVHLPEGAAVEVLLSDDNELSAHEFDELEAALEESAKEFARGECEDARAFARKLAARS